MKTLQDFLEEHNGIYEAPFAKFILNNDGTIRMETENEICISDDWWTLADVVEFRVCDVCGCPYDMGYMHNEGNFHACSEECVKADANERYGENNWKWCTEWTEEEMDEFESDDEVGCLIYKNNNGEWELDETFYTEW